MNGLGNKQIMAKNIQYYMDLNGKSRSEMCDALGVKYTTFTDWVKGNVYPRIDKIELMANYFGISKSDLVEEKTERTEVELLDSIASQYGQDCTEVIEIYIKFHEDERKKLNSILAEYYKLDEIDRAEVRGRIMQFIESMLNSDKYSAQEELKHA